MSQSIAAILAGGGTPMGLAAPAAEASSAAASTSPTLGVEALGRARDLDEMERIRRAVHAAGEAAYHWDIASDRLTWAGEAAGALNLPELATIASGRAYARLLHRDSLTSRFETIMRSTVVDDGEGVPYCIEYELRPHGPEQTRGHWVEDCGRWYAGPEGRPAEAYGLVRSIDDRHERDQRLRYLGNCDPLTGMTNRARLAEALGETVAAALRDGTSFAFLIAAVSNLPVVNDAYGFDIADEVILAVARRLRQAVRTGDSIGRYSGSKFGLILADCSEQDVEIAAERFLGAARDSVIEANKGPVWATLSIGGVVLPKHASDAGMALARAEEALAEAQRQPTDNFVLFKPSAERAFVRNLNARCGAEIVSSLRENRLTLAFQPIVAARDGAVAMHEALLRLIDPGGEKIEAAHLVPVAEKLGLIRLVDRAVMGLAVSELLGHAEARLSLNVSGITATDPRWSALLADILRENPSVTDRLMIEITETVALHDLAHITAFIDRLRELGCKVAIDDFGAGYTSFRNLKLLKVDMVKIDGSFCQRLADNPDNRHFVRSLIDLAQKFDVRTIAEWVQIESDAELLTQWGVDYLQGNLFGEASPTLAPATQEKDAVAEPFRVASEDWPARPRAGLGRPGQEPPGDTEPAQGTDPAIWTAARVSEWDSSDAADVALPFVEAAGESEAARQEGEFREHVSDDALPQETVSVAGGQSDAEERTEPESALLRQALAALDAFRSPGRTAS